MSVPTIKTLSITASDRLFILTGAGISAESGVSTFRDKGGLWEQHRFEDVASIEAWQRDPELVWRFYSARREQAARCEANPAHQALAKLEAALGERLFLCTQNVDHLHEAGGSETVHHMHGELFKTRCENRRCRSAPFEDRSSYPTKKDHASCKACGATLRPHIVWFGEEPFGLDRIAREIERCTIFVCIGSSGAVYPAAAFASRARERGAKSIYVGPEPPDNASSFTELRLGKAATVVPALFYVEPS